MGTRLGQFVAESEAEDQFAHDRGIKEAVFLSQGLPRSPVHQQVHQVARSEPVLRGNKSARITRRPRHNAVFLGYHSGRGLEERINTKGV